MNRILHAFLLVFVFLFAQVGATVHAASHATLASHGNDKGMPSDDTCELCVGYGQLSGSTPLPAHKIMPVSVARLQVSSVCPTFSSSRTLVHSLSRAPPRSFLNLA